MTPIRQTKPRLTDSPDWTGWKAFFERQKAEREDGNMSIRAMKIARLKKIYTAETLSDWFLATFFPEHLFDAVMAGFNAGELQDETTETVVK